MPADTKARCRKKILRGRSARPNGSSSKNSTSSPARLQFVSAMFKWRAEHLAPAAWRCWRQCAGPRRASSVSSPPAVRTPPRNRRRRVRARSRRGRCSTMPVELRIRLLDGPGRREAVLGHAQRSCCRSMMPSTSFKCSAIRVPLRSFHRNHGTSLYPPASVTRMAGAAASFSIFCRNR